MCGRCKKTNLGEATLIGAGFGDVPEAAPGQGLGAFVDPNARQKRLWEIEPSWHCSVLGTCLTLGDLRKVARKIGFKGLTDPEDDIDAYLHGTFVRGAREQSTPTKMIEKLLNRRHAVAVKRFHATRDVATLGKEWRAAFKQGDVAGPYWAVISHPFLDAKLGARVFNDVHMLSHLVGSSNRAALSNLRRLETDLAGAMETIETTRTRSAEKLRQRDDRIAALEARVMELTGRLDSALDRVSTTGQDETRAAASDTDGPERRRLEGENTKLAERAARAEGLGETLRHEITSLEDAIATPAMDADRPDAVLDAPFMGLEGGTYLYVGGRTRAVGRMVDMARKHGATLHHHDGGLEDSHDALARAVRKADAVFFPTDCVSHGAMFRVKELCKHRNIPFVPLRTCGVASFVEGLGRLPQPSHPLMEDIFVGPRSPAEPTAGRSLR